MTRPFRFDRAWDFDGVTVERLWAAVSSPQRFPLWWSWLDDADLPTRLEPGVVARFTVRPPLPYTLRFAVAIDDVVPGCRVDATVDGDVAGPASLEVAATGGGSSARLVWTLDIRRPALARVERVARPAMVYGHDLVIALGVRQFRRRALRDHSAAHRRVVE